MEIQQNHISYTIQNLIKDKKAFVFYRKPKAQKVNLIIQKSVELHTIHSFEDSGFVFAPFSKKDKAIFFPTTDSEISFFQMPSKNDTIINEQQVFQYDKQDYLDLLKETIAFIQKKNADKIVLSRCIKYNYSEDSIGKIYENLLQTYQEAFVYIWSHPKVGLWMGATPEQLLTKDKDSFSTMSLAGTQLYSDNLHWEEKEKQEQKWVTDFITTQLKTLSSKLEISKPFTKKAGHLAHICTEINGEIAENKTLKDLIDSLHPTPAVCGTPRDVATYFILNNENYNREFYTGFLGEINKDNQSELYVNLRCLQLKKGVAKIYVGGGITKDSIPEKEWEETVVKSAVLGKFLK